MAALALIASSVLIAGAATRSSDGKATAAGKAAKKKPKPTRVRLACARTNGTLRYITRESQCRSSIGKLVKIDPGPADLCIKRHGTRRGTRAARGRGGRRLPAGTTRITDQLALCGPRNQPNEQPLRLPNTRKEWFCVERGSKFMRWVHRKPRCRTTGRYPEFVAYVPKGGPFPEPQAPQAQSPQNKAPKSNDDSATTDEDSPAIISVLANDTDDDGDALSIESVDTSGTRGAVTVNANGTVTYDPTDEFNDLEPGETAGDRFKYKAKDPSGAHSGTANVDVTVTGGNDAPTIKTSSGSPSFTENQAGNVAVDSGLSLNDADSTTLDSAAVAITAGFVPLADDLDYTAPSAITGTYDSGTGVLTFTGTASVADYEAVLRSVKFSTTSEDPGTTRTLEFTATDGGGDESDAATRNLSVVSVNDAPVNTLPGAQTTSEDTPLPLTSALSVADADANPDDVRTTLSVANGSLSVDSTTGTITGQNTGSVQIQGTVAEVNSAIDSVQYSPNANFNGSDSLAVTTTDLGNEGTGGVLTDSDNVAITVNPVNDAPVNTVAGAQTINEDAPALTMATAFSVADVDAGTDDVKTTLAVTDGVLTVVASPAVSGNGTDTVVIEGTTAEVNNALASVTYDSDLDFNGSDPITVTTSDLAHNPAPELTDTDTVAVNVNAVNDAPVLTSPLTRTLDEDSSLTFEDGQPSEISVADVDAGGDNVQVTLSVLHGMLSDGGLPTSTLTLTGSLATVNAALDGLTYTPNANYNGFDTVTVSVSDLGRNGAGGPLTDSSLIELTVNSINDAPVFTAPGPQTVVENGSLPFSSATTNALTLSDVDAAGFPMVATLSVAHGTLTVPDTSGLLFHTGNGTGSVTVNGSQTAITAALNGLVYAPTSGYTGPDSLTINANDLGASGSGGPLASPPAAVPILVDALNKAPINSVPGPQTVNEDAPLVFSSGNGNAISTSDVDLGANPVQMTLSVDSGTLTLGGLTGLTFTSGDGTNDPTMTFTGTLAQVNAALSGLTYQGAANDNATRTLTVTTNDQGFTGVGGPQSDTDTVTINQTAVNDAPVNTVPGTQSVDEDQTLTMNGAFAVNDVDAGSGDIEVSVTSALSSIHVDDSGTATVSFNDTQSVHIVGTVAEVNHALATVTYLGAANLNGARTLTLTSEDNGNTGTGGVLLDSDDVTINVNEVNDAPIANVPASVSTFEGQAFTFTAGDTPTVADVDSDPDPLEMTLSVQNGTLTLDGTTGLTFSAGDGSGDTTMTFQGTRAAINDALSGMRYDPTPGYNNTDPAGPPAVLSYSVSDLGNNGSGPVGTDTASTDITVTEANSPPINSVPGAQTFNEDSTRTFSTANTNPISVSDPDAGTANLQVTLSVSTGILTLGDTSGLGSHSGDGTGSVTATGSQTALNSALQGLVYTPNANTNGTDTLTVATDDLGNSGGGGPQTDTDNVTLNVTAVNDQPVNTVPGAQSVNEDTDLAFPGTISVADVEAGSGDIRTTLAVSHGTLTLGSIPAGLTFPAGDGTSDPSMTLEGTQSEINTALNGLKYRGNQDFFSGPTETLTVTTNDLGLTPAPATEDSDNVAITVNPVNDAPNADNESLTGANRAVGNTALRVTETGRDAGGPGDPDGPQKDLSGDTGEIPPLHGDTDVDNTAAELRVKDTDGTDDGVINLTTNDGGQVVMDSDGDYVFFPDNVDSCFDHSDFFDYTVTDQGTPEGTDTGRVTIAVQDCVWYTDANVASHGDGRSHTPFKTFADIDSPTGAGDSDFTSGKIFVYDGTYSGGLPLENTQQLLSQRHGLKVDNGDGDSDLADLELHAADSGAGDSTVNGGVVLANDNTLEGIDFGDSGNSAVYALSTNTNNSNLSAVGITAGALKVNTVTSGGINNPSGGAVNIIGGSSTMNVQLDELSSANTTNNAVRIENSGGTFNTTPATPGATTGTLTGRTSAEVSNPLVLLDGGNTTFTLNSQISDSGSEQLVSVRNQTGGTKTFNALVKRTNGLGAASVSLQSNTGGTVTRFDKGFEHAGTSAGGIVATSGGTLAIPDPGSGTAVPNNFVTTSTGTPLNLASTTIHDNDLVFERVTSLGAANGIVLDTTANANGRLFVNGTGSANTGGTIQNSVGTGVSLTNVPGGVRLDRMSVTGGGADGVFGSSVSDFTMQNSTVSTNGNAPGEHGLDFTALTGTADLTNTTISSNRARGVSVVNDSGALTMTLNGTTISNHSHATDGEDGLNLKGTGTGTQTLNVTTSTFSNNRGDQIQVLTDDSNTVTQNVSVQSSIFTPVAASFNSGGIAVTAANSANVFADINDNEITGGANGVNLNFGNSPDAGTTGTGTMRTIVRNNTITSRGDGIRVVGNKGATMTTRVTNNNVQGYTLYGIEVHRADGNGVTNATITGNVVHNPNNDPLNPALDGIHAQAGAGGTADSGTSCFDIGGSGLLKNSVVGSHGVQSGGPVGFDIQVRNRASTRINMPGYVGTATDLAAVEAYLEGRNTAGPTFVDATRDATGLGYFNTSPAGSACPQPD